MLFWQCPFNEKLEERKSPEVKSASSFDSFSTIFIQEAFELWPGTERK
jgi:hypothetical protein